MFYEKAVLFALLTLICNLAYSQASLTVKNSTQVCTGYLNVWAADATTGNGGRCDISTCTIVIPPMTTWVWTNPVEIMTGGTVFPFAPAVGFCGQASPFTAPMLAAALPLGTWIWTDAQIQYSCQVLPLPNPACTEGGCFLEGIQCGAGPGTCLGVGGLSWTPSVCGGMTGATWSPVANCFMTNVTITIN